MREEELIALVQTIADELTAANRQDDLKQLDAIMGDLITAHKTTAYDALGALEDLLADISAVPEHSSVAQEEWDARRTDFCRRRSCTSMHAGSRLRAPRATERHEA